MHKHPTLRERVERHLDLEREPLFEPSRDPVLVAFADLLVDSDLISFDANKRVRADPFSPVYDCETESVREIGTPPEVFTVVWTPAWASADPLTGFRQGHDSAALGSTPAIAMPQDERTAALLLLVTSDYVHLSARYQAGRLVVQGAIDSGGAGFRLVELVPGPAPGLRELMSDEQTCTRADPGPPAAATADPSVR